MDRPRRLADRVADPGPNDPSPVWVTIPPYAEPAVFEILDPLSHLDGLLVSGFIRTKATAKTSPSANALAGMTKADRDKLARCLRNPASEVGFAVAH
jgi:hypothetical protein